MFMQFIHCSCGVSQPFFYAIMVIIKVEIVFAGNHDFVGVGQCTQKFVELPHIIQDPVSGHVAGVEQEVSVWNFQGPVQSVGIADGDDFHEVVI